MSKVPSDNFVLKDGDIVGFLNDFLKEDNGSHFCFDLAVDMLNFRHPCGIRMVFLGFVSFYVLIGLRSLLADDGLSCFKFMFFAC